MKSQKCQVIVAKFRAGKKLEAGVVRELDCNNSNYILGSGAAEAAPTEVP